MVDTIFILANPRRSVERVAMSVSDPPVNAGARRFGRPTPYRGIGSEIIHLLCGLYLRIGGWHLPDDWPAAPKMVILAAPHTSNWDGVNMLAVAGWYRVKLSYMGKRSLTTGPFGWLVKRSGCVPVERSKSSDIVSQMRDAFAATDSLFLAVAPEGTRTRNTEWKTGYYHIAHSAGVPLLVSVLDYSARAVRLAGPMPTSGDYAADLPKILEHYAKAQGRRPGQFALPELR
jgi:1-acyl-sn-glycerol-3-phosphate acyltransferase